MRTVGVEEELLLIDGLAGHALPVGDDVQANASDESLTTKFVLQQTEVATGPHFSMDSLAKDIRQRRINADAAAEAAGARIAALGTSPLPFAPVTTPDPRYEQIIERFGVTSAEQITCGCHMHVSINSDEEAVGVLDRIRIWLPVLTALSANSPYWNGADTGYASFRSQIWHRMPVTGPTSIFGSAGAYHRRVSELLSTGVLLDEGMLYFDARLSQDHPTVEIRVADVCLEPDDTVLIATLAKALVETSARRWYAACPTEPVPDEVVRLAGWRASKSGLNGQLLHPLEHHPCEAATAVEALVRHVRPVLTETGDQEMVGHLLTRLLWRGTGAQRQRATFAYSGDPIMSCSNPSG